MAMTAEELAKKKLAIGAGFSSSAPPPGISSNTANQSAEQQASLSDVPRVPGQPAIQRPQLGISSVSNQSAPMAPASEDKSKPLMINGVPHQNIDSTGGNLLPMIGLAYSEQAKMLAPSPFENRANAIREKNRAELSGEQQGNVYPQLGISANSNPSLDAVRSEHQRILDGSPLAAGAVSLKDQVKQGIQKGFQDNRAKFMADKKFSSFEDKGGGIVRGVGNNGAISFTNVGTAEATNPNKAPDPTNSIDFVGSNASLARANAIRQEMIDNAASANGRPGDGYFSFGDGGIAASNAEKTKRWAIDDAASKVARANGRSERAAASQMFNTMVNSSTQERGQDINRDMDMSRQGILARGQDINAMSEANRLIGNPNDQALNRAQAEGITADTESKRAISELQKKALAGDQQALASYRSLTGKGADYKDRYITFPNRKVYNEFGQITGEEPGGIFDAATGHPVQIGAQPSKQASSGKEPQAGEVRGGYKFKGGNPADKASWEKV